VCTISRALKFWLNLLAFWRRRGNLNFFFAIKLLCKMTHFLFFLISHFNLVDLLTMAVGAR
jgi:hypothetical protein